MNKQDIKSFIKKLRAFGLFIPMSNLILVYLNKYLSYSFKIRIASYRNAAIQKKIQRIFDIVSITTDNIICEVDKDHLPIWYCWLQGEDKLPKIPRLCLQSIRKYSDGHPVIVLTFENYRQYVTLPPNIEDLYVKGVIKSAHFADILRVNLLEQRGGLWLDSTILLTKNIPDNIFSMPFFSVKEQENRLYVSQCRWAVFCLGGFPHNVVFQFVAKCFTEYLSRQDCFVDYFMFDHFIDMAYQNNLDIRRLVDEIPYNNENVHKLSPLLCNSFNEVQFRELTKDTYIFKLSWREYTDEELECNPDNYYHYISQLLGCY